MAPPRARGGFYRWVSACNDVGCSLPTVGPAVTVSLPTTVTVPTGLQACRVGAGGRCVAAGPEVLELSPNATFVVSWNAVANATSYTWKRTTSSGCTATVTTTGTVTATQVSGVAGSVTCGSTVSPRDQEYAIQACAGATCSGWTIPTVTVRGAPIVTREAPPVATYIHTDALRSPVAETDAAGAVVKRSAYRPWGDPADGSYAQGPGYTGHVTDALTGLSYMQQRYYDPVAGRFLSVDPIPANPGSFNRYWYANDNPYKYIDPDGRESVGEMIDSGAQGCGPVSCAGWAALYSAWTVLGAEGISQAYDKGWSNVGVGGRVGAAFEIAAVLPPIKILKEAPLAYKIAAGGGEHAGFLARQMESSIGQLRKTIRSLEKQISLHEDKINNPAKYMTKQDPSIPGNVARAVKDWKGYIQRQTKQMDIAKEVLNQKSTVCTGTHIVSKC